MLTGGSTRSLSTSPRKLIDRLDDNDDVQNVAANFNIPDDVMAKAEALA